MILHASIVADDPESAARAIARLWVGEAFAMPGPGEGTWGVITERHPGEMIEVLRRGSEFHARTGEHVDVRIGTPVRQSGIHILLETPLDHAALMAAADEEGVPIWKVDHGFFDVYEAWLDGCFLLEVMTPEMAAHYRSIITIENARAYAAGQLQIPVAA